MGDGKVHVPTNSSVDLVAGFAFFEVEAQVSAAYRQTLQPVLPHALAPLPRHSCTR